MSGPAHTDLQAALDAEHAQRLALQHHAADQAQRVADLEAEIERLRGLLSREQQARHAALAARLAEIEQAEPQAHAVAGPAGQVYWIGATLAEAARFAGQLNCQTRLIRLIARPAPSAAPDEVPMRCAECGQLGWHKLGCSHVAHERGARLMVRLAPAQDQPTACRDDGRCQYAIDHGAEGLGHCPPGKCAMPKGGAA